MLTRVHGLDVRRRFQVRAVLARRISHGAPKSPISDENISPKHWYCIIEIISEEEFMSLALRAQINLVESVLTFSRVSGSISRSYLRELNITCSDKWSPALQIRTVLLSVQALLSSPNPDDPLATDVAKHYKASIVNP